MLEPDHARKLIRESAAIVLAAAVLGFLVNLFHPRGFILTGREAAAFRRIVTISAEEAKIKFDGGIAVFIDARDRSAYDSARVAGAVHVPAEPESVSMNAIRANFELIRQPREAVIYCDGGGCGDSDTLAQRLVRMEYPRTLYILQGGFPEWEEKGYAVTRGAE
jgi:rhodanese-related sulfurtransferase